MRATARLVQYDCLFPFFIPTYYADLCSKKNCEAMKKQYLSAPLPFQGQKRMFAKEYIKVLKENGRTFDVMESLSWMVE